MKRRKFTNQADGNDRTKMPRTGDGRTAKGRKPKDVGTLQMRSTPDGMSPEGGLRRRQPEGWGIARVLGFGKKHGPDKK